MPYAAYSASSAHYNMSTCTTGTPQYYFCTLISHTLHILLHINLKFCCIIYIYIVLRTSHKCYTNLCIFRFKTSYFAHKNINKYEVVSRCECVQLWWSQVRWRYPPATPGQAPKIPVRVAEKSSPSPAVHSSPATHGPGPGPGDGGERADSDTAGCPQGPGPRRVRRRVGGTGESGPARLRERWTRRHHCRPRAGRGQSWA